MPAAMPAPPNRPQRRAGAPAGGGPGACTESPKPSGNGSWAVVIDSFAEESVAEQRSAQIARMGLPAEVAGTTAKEQVRYRVVVPGYSTQDAANAAAASCAAARRAGPG